MRFVAAVAAASTLTLVGCAGSAEEPSASRSAAPAGTSGSTSAGEGASPARAADLIGTWDYQLDPAERRAILEDFSDLVDGAQEVTARLAFVNDRKWWLGYLFDGELFLLDGVPEGDGGRYEVDGDQLETTGAGGLARITYRWTLDGTGQTLVAVEECDLYPGVEPSCTTDRTDMDPLMLLVTEHTFTWSGDDVSY